MANIIELLAQIGALDAPKKNTVSTAGATARYRAQTAPIVPPVSPGNGQIDWSQSAAKPQSKGDSSFAGDVWGFIKKGIDIVDTPRAFVVSGIKEGFDAAFGSDNSWFGRDTANGVEAQHASWKDFVDQGWSNIGYGDVVQDYGDMPLPAKRVLGFAGDVAADPLTYTGTGLVAKGAGEGVDLAERALAQAAKHGGRDAIAKQLADQAVKEGIRYSPAVEKVIAEAGQRGTGALTRKALKEAGLTAEEIERLGIGRLTKTVYGMAVPGTTRIAEAGAEAKGYLKKVFGESRWAEAARKAKIADTQGERFFIDAMRSKGVSAAKRAEAATALLSVNKARSVSSGWFDLAARTSAQTLGKDLHHLSDDALVDATHALEAGADDVLSKKTRGLFDWVNKSTNELGAESGYLPNYVPHIVTDDFHKLAEDQPELLKWITDPTTKQGFQKTRLLQAGSDFMGVKLAEGTIKEINEIAVAKVGVKIFEDNLAKIIPTYLVKARRALLTQAQNKALKEFGVVTEASSKKVGKRAFTDAEKATKKALKEAAGEARSRQSIALADGMVIRRSEAKAARTAIRAQKKEVAKAIVDIDRAVADLGRARAAAQAGLTRVETELSSAQAALEATTKVAKAQRGAEKRATTIKLKQLETKIAELTAAREGAANELKKIVEGGGKGRSKAALGFKAQVDAYGAERDALVGQQSELAQKLVTLKNATIGDGASEAERAVSQETARVASLKVGADTARNTAHVAEMSYSFALADHAVVTDLLNKTEGQLDEAMTKIIGMPSGGARLEARKVAAAEIRDRVAFVRKLLEKRGDPAWEIMAKQEAQAVILDMKAWRAGHEAFNVEKVLATMNDPKFREYIVAQADHGMTMIDDANQMPSWINDALTVEHRMKSPQLWQDFSKQANKFNQIWKGWATARPGFMTRNAYGGMFNIWLEGGPQALNSAREFISFWRMYKADPQNYLENALKKWDQTTIDQMDSGLKVVFGTGGGLVPAEVEAGAGKSLTLKPWSTDNVFIRGTRAGSENIEAVLRGGHAYDVMRRGGTADLAQDIVTKWHFNYVDITELDRSIKTVGMPFWTFYSRNLALQAHVWSHMPQKLNRSYFNAMRNLEMGNDQDVNRPQWFDESGAIQLGQGGEGHDTPYLFPELPSIKAVNGVQNLLNVSDGRMLADLNPIVKLPLEHFQNKQSFSGVPFRNSLSETVDGTKVGREAPSWAQIPGIEQLLAQIGLVDHNASGQTVMTDQAQYMGESAFPLLANISKLLPNQPKNEAKTMQNWLSFLGLGVKYNTDSTRGGEQYRRELQAAAAAKRAKELGL